MRNEYQFLSRWRVDGTCGEVADVLGEPLALPEWWPSVYLEVQEVRPPDARGHGRRVRLRTKGWLPYTIHWEFEEVESDTRTASRSSRMATSRGAACGRSSRTGPA